MKKKLILGVFVVLSALLVISCSSEVTPAHTHSWEADSSTGTLTCSSCGATKSTPYCAIVDGTTVTSVTDYSTGADISISSEEANTYYVLMNGGNLTVYAPNSTLYFFGTADSTSINAIAANSFHIKGSITTLEVTIGRVVVEENASVTTFMVEGTGVELAVVSMDDFENIQLVVGSDVTSTTITKISSEGNKEYTAELRYSESSSTLTERIITKFDDNGDIEYKVETTISENEETTTYKDRENQIINKPEDIDNDPVISTFSEKDPSVVDDDILNNSLATVLLSAYNKTENIVLPKILKLVSSVEEIDESWISELDASGTITFKDSESFSDITAEITADKEKVVITYSFTSGYEFGDLKNGKNTLVQTHYYSGNNFDSFNLNGNTYYNYRPLYTLMNEDLVVVSGDNNYDSGTVENTDYSYYTYSYTLTPKADIQIDSLTFNAGEAIKYEVRHYYDGDNFGYTEYVINGEIYSDQNYELVSSIIETNISYSNIDTVSLNKSSITISIDDKPLTFAIDAIENVQVIFSEDDISITEFTLALSGKYDGIEVSIDVTVKGGIGILFDGDSLPEFMNLTITAQDEDAEVIETIYIPEGSYTSFTSEDISIPFNSTTIIGDDVITLSFDIPVSDLIDYEGEDISEIIELMFNSDSFTVKLNDNDCKEELSPILGALLSTL